MAGPSDQLNVATIMTAPVMAIGRAVIIGRGGHGEVVSWASGTARLLPRYLNGRRRGPMFVTIRQPNVVPR